MVPEIVIISACKQSPKHETGSLKQINVTASLCLSFLSVHRLFSYSPWIAHIHHILTYENITAFHIFHAKKESSISDFSTEKKVVDKKKPPSSSLKSTMDNIFCVVKSWMWKKNHQKICVILSDCLLAYLQKWCFHFL